MQIRNKFTKILTCINTNIFFIAKNISIKKTYHHIFFFLGGVGCCFRTNPAWIGGDRSISEKMDASYVPCFILSNRTLYFRTEIGKYYVFIYSVSSIKFSLQSLSSKCSILFKSRCRSTISLLLKLINNSKVEVA